MYRARLFVVAILLAGMSAPAERTRLRPGGFNTFSPKDDVELGREVAKDAEKQLELVTNNQINSYIAGLGSRLVAVAPNESKFPFTFKVVNDRSMNAFALPGGPVYIHRGAIEAADNEAQLAGVIGHEISHIVLRHGTSQASKGQLFQLPLAILGGLAGDNNAGRIATQLGGFAAGSVLLRYSRDAETDADLMGTQILYDAGYDPAAMAQFFDKLAKENKGSRVEQFFSDHPIPENRVAKVNEEIRKIGPARANQRTNSTAFQRSKRQLLAMPEPRTRR